MVLDESISQQDVYNMLDQLISQYIVYNDVK